MSHTPVRVRAPLHSLPIPQLTAMSPTSPAQSPTMGHAAAKATDGNAVDSSPTRGKAGEGSGAVESGDSGSSSGSVNKRQRLSDGGLAVTGSGEMPNSPAPVAAQAAHAWAAAPSTAQQQQAQAAWGSFKREPTSADSKPKLQQTRARACLIPPMPGMVIAPDMAPPFRTAFDMMQDEKPLLSLGDEYLDAPLQGGLGEGITELVGESACGKTQLGMQLLLHCQLPKSEGGLNGGALFIAMEGEFPISRLRSMAQNFQHRYPKIRDPLNKVYIKTLNTPDELSKVLHQSLRPSLEKGDVKLVVLDSIAAMFRAEHSGQEQDFTKRSQDFLSIAAQLKQLSSTFHVPVVVINQVSDFFAGADGNGGEALSIDQVKHSYLHHWSMMSSGRRVVPALGLTWANCVNTRIFLTRRHEFVQPVYAPAQGRGLMQPLPPTAGDPSVYNPLVNMFTGGGARANPAPQLGGGGMQLLPPQQFQQQSALPMAPQQMEPPPTRMRRFLHVQFAPHLPPATAEFLIETAGLRGTSNLDDVQLSPTASPAAGSGWQKDDTPTSGIPQLQALNGGFSAAAAAPAVPSVTPQSYVRNMYTPSGSASASAAAVSPSASPHSRLDADEVGRTEEDERQELLMLERVEAEMRQRQQAQLAQQKLQTFSSPPQPFATSPQQQQQQPTQWRPSPPKPPPHQQQPSTWYHSPPQSFQ